jgi:predicted SAM-dependent methyltransferase
MVEHLDRAEAQFFFGEARRCLVKTGILRIVVPDLRMIVDRYLATGNADEAVAALMLAQPKPRGIAQRLLRLLVEWRDHRWMYDGDSLKGALEVAGYSHVQILPPGETLISDPAGLNLRERERNSVYVEAIK